MAKSVRATVRGMRWRGKVFLRKYRGEIFINLAIGIFLLAVGVVVEQIVRGARVDGEVTLADVHRDVMRLMLLGAVGLIALLLQGAGTTFDLKRLIRKLVDPVVWGQDLAGGDTQHFGRRGKHWPEEKMRLGAVLADYVLPEVVETALAEFKAAKHLNLFIDAGTTVMHSFVPLIQQGLSLRDDMTLTIFTNNVAGVEMVQRLANPSQFRIAEKDIVLIPGSPQRRYRSTSGVENERYLHAKLAKRTPGSRDPNAGEITISVVTGNWILTGAKFDELIICARGDGHVYAKRAAHALSDYVIVVAPLGKFLPRNSTNRLMDAMVAYPDERESADTTYEMVRICDSSECNRSASHNWLLSTLRRRGDAISPLARVSRGLRSAPANRTFTLSSHSPDFEYKIIDRNLLYAAEMPHLYVRESYDEIFG